MRHFGVLWLLLAGSVGCQPAFQRTPSLIDAPRILAVRATPAEARPGAGVVVEALLVDPSGPVTATAPGWAFCVKPRPAADYNTISAKCLEEVAPHLRPFSSGADPLRAMATLPLEGCALFGSEPLPPAQDEPPVRPADPDPTGGYYQPVRVSWAGGGPVAFGQVRLQCALPQASANVAQAFRDRYVANHNPILLALELADGATTVAPRAAVRLVGRWDAAEAEAYVAYDLRTSALQDRVEGLRISWFATGGQLDADTGLSADGVSAEVGWIAPAEPGLHHLWAVLRDDRGGMSWRHLALEVR